MPTTITPACDVACLGILVADAVGLPIDALPTRGTLALVERIELHSGGNGANTSLALAKLGVPVALLGSVGADNLGDFLTGSLSRHGVDVAGVKRDLNAPTSATLVAVHSDAQRSFLHSIGANAAFTEADVDWNKTRGAKIFHVAGPQLMPQIEGEPLARIVQEAKARGMTTVLDTVMNPRSLGWDGIAPCLPYLDWAVPSLEEAHLLTGEESPVKQARCFKNAGAKNVAIKMADAGCFVSPADSESFSAPALTVTAVDSLGAGDCWTAGFIVGLLRGWDLEKVAHFANAVGACSVQAIGATTGVCSETDTLALLEENNRAFEHE